MMHNNQTPLRVSIKGAKAGKMPNKTNLLNSMGKSTDNVSMGDIHSDMMNGKSDD